MFVLYDCPCCHKAFLLTHCPICNKDFDNLCSKEYIEKHILGHSIRAREYTYGNKKKGSGRTPLHLRTKELNVPINNT